MTKEDFENQLLEDLLTGKVEESVYGYIGYIEDNLSILKEHKDCFRQYFLNDPEGAYWYAKYVDKGPRDDTRQGACKDPEGAYWYAKYVDKGPRDDTRQGACKDPEYAYLYARGVDKCPRDDTKQGVCKDPEYAYLYAIYVDKCFNAVTFNTVKNTIDKECYLRNIEKGS